MEILIISDERSFLDKILSSYVVVKCSGGTARIIKDRTGRAFNLVIENLDDLEVTLRAIYPKDALLHYA